MVNIALQASASVRRWKQFGSLVYLGLLLGFALGGLSSIAQDEMSPRERLRSVQALSSPAVVPSKSQQPKAYTLQVGAYRVERHAEEAVAELRQKGYEAYLVVEPDAKQQLWHKVRFGRYASLAEAQAQRHAFKTREQRDALVVLSTRVPSDIREKRASVPPPPGGGAAAEMPAGDAMAQRPPDAEPQAPPSDSREERASVPPRPGGGTAAAMPPGDPMDMIPPDADLQAPPIPLIFPTALDRPMQRGRPFMGLLRYHEDWGFLKDPANRTEFWDPLKYIPLGKADWYLSLGGETRQRFEIYDNFPFSPLAPSDDGGYYMMRYMLHGDLHLGQNVRLFAEFKSAIIFDKDFVTGADKNELDVNQLFIDFKGRLGDAGDFFTLRVGRQELHYGMGRLLTIREGPNNRQGWDGVRGILRRRRSQIDAFYTLSVEDDPYVFDDAPSGDQMIWGLYYTVRPKFLPGAGIDVYYLGDAFKDAVYFQGTGDEVRHSAGVRFFGGHGRLDWDTEAILQFGAYAGHAIWAYSLSVGGGYTIPELPTRPRFTLGLDVASGDRRELDEDLQTFRPIVFRGNYSGEAAFLQLSNVIKVHPGVDLHLRRDMYLYLDFPFFWRVTSQDGLYSPGGFLVAGPIPERQRVFVDPMGNLVVLPQIDDHYVGFQPSMQFIWQMTQYLRFSFSYAHFFLGDFLEKVGQGDADFGAVWLLYQF